MGTKGENAEKTDVNVKIEGGRQMRARKLAKDKARDRKRGEI